MTEAALSRTDEPDWQKAACIGMDTNMFYPEESRQGRRELEREVKQVCAGCEIRNDCLVYAIEEDIAHGIWGGLSYRDRRRLQRSKTLGSKAVDYSRSD